jgi:NADH:ubiquinone oxidoreductase subunit C
MKPTKDKLLEKAKEVSTPRARRMSMTINKTDFWKSMKKLVDSNGFKHLSTITGIDVGSKIELIYHLTRENLVLSLKVKTSKKNPVLPSIVNLIPGAVLYEREVHDLLGVTFKGNLDLSPLLLPDGWPNDIYPMRKEWAPQDIRKAMEKP